jgi:hypothetical protein
MDRDDECRDRTTRGCRHGERHARAARDTCAGRAGAPPCDRTAPRDGLLP